MSVKTELKKTEHRVDTLDVKQKNELRRLTLYVEKKSDQSTELVTHNVNRMTSKADTTTENLSRRVQDVEKET